MKGGIGDADTLVAIAGSLAEAYYGIPQSISEQELAYFDSCGDLRAIIDEFAERLKEGPKKNAPARERFS